MAAIAKIKKRKKLTNTLVFFTRLFLRTIDVGPAALDAGDSPAELPRTAVGVGAADLLAEVGDAELPGLAVGVGVAHGLAEAGVALEVLRALLVAGAPDGLSGAADDGGGVGGEAGAAGAGGPLVEGLADGVGATGHPGAGVLTAVVDAGEGRRAVGVLAASNQAHFV